VAVAAPAHAGDEIVRFHKHLPVAAAERAALVRVDDERLAELAPPDGHQQALDRQFTAHPRLHRPAHDLPRDEIKTPARYSQPYCVR
jgi:hypothetical protein